MEELTLALPPLLFLEDRGGRLGKLDVAEEAEEVAGALLGIVGESVKAGASPEGEVPSIFSDLTDLESILFRFVPLPMDEVGILGTSGSPSIEDARMLAVLSMHNPPGRETEGGSCT